MNRTYLRRLVVTLGAAALLPAAAGAALAQDVDSSVEESTSTAEATALEVGDVVVIGQTSGQTTGDDGESSATAVGVGGETVSGGEQSEPGTSEGELVGTGETPLGEASVAPYEATVEEDGSTSSSASLATVVLVDEDTVYVRLLGSDSQTSPTGSSGHADGAQVTLGGSALDAHVLHALSSSQGDAGAAVVVLNDNGVVTDEQADGAFCPLDAEPLVDADVVCAATSDGVAEADVVDGAALDGNLPLGAATTDVQAAPGGDAGDTGDVAPDAAPPADRTDTLPRTGLSVLALLGIATGSIGAGTALKRGIR